MDLTGRVRKNFQESIQSAQAVLDEIGPAIADSARLMTDAIMNGNKILSCGNGVSAADAQHFSSSMINQYEVARPGLPAIALTTDSSTLTSVANDHDFADIFARQIFAIGLGGDVLLAISTSGRSSNIIRAIDVAHERNMQVVFLTGNDGGKMAGQITGNDREIRVSGPSTARIQEIHLLVIHCLCDLIDTQLMGLEE